MNKGHDRELWDLLEEGRVPESDLGSTVWPKVRAQTLDNNSPAGWFFGDGSLVRGAVAAGAVVVGLMVGVMLPGISQQAQATDQGSDESTGLWSDESSWLDETATTGLAEIWLDPGMQDESEGS
ncbi:MAG: hypothetical protein GY780_18305 [bacterium]|nr:hypothetical protein [bacterium]